MTHESCGWLMNFLNFRRVSTFANMCNVGVIGTGKNLRFAIFLAGSIAITGEVLWYWMK
jgi:hypothetical protein